MYENIKAVVVGDFMTDVWYDSHNVKLCPSFPALDFVDPYVVERKSGGAGNVSAIINHVGARGELCSPASQMTLSKKYYYIHQDQLVFRVSTHPDIYDSERNYIVGRVCQELQDADAVIISDYNKGALAPDAIKKIIDNAKYLDIPVIVDPKFDNWEYYKGCEIIRCNIEEYDNSNWRDSSAKHYVITRGADGMVVKTGVDSWVVPAIQPSRVYDVNGAGDVVTAIMTLEYIRNGGDILKACYVATVAAHISVQHPRTYRPSLDEIKKAGAFDE